MYNDLAFKYEPMNLLQQFLNKPESNLKASLNGKLPINKIL